MQSQSQSDIASLEQALDRHLTEGLANGTVELPIMRHSVMQVLELCQQPEFEVRAVVDVVMTDPSLAAHLLRVVNSAQFRAAQRIDSIGEAVNRLGARQVQAVAAGLMLKSDVYRGCLRHGLRVRKLWQHAALTGVFGRDLGQLSGVEPRGAMLIGLLHDVGKPLALGLIDDVEKELGLTLDESTLDSVLNGVHGKLGAAVASHWSLPEALIAAIEHHHDPDSAGEHQRVAALAQMADALAHWAEAPTAEGGRQLLVHPALPSLGLTGERLGPLFRGHAEARQIALAM